ncbi:Pre-mRNA-splicing factor 38A [Armadillidium nasatum]|uniref:Pre-mRNA-splicing factor 38 n=1 Tax=Armadillidium nasatum TaxID=96803 RepID=A0A5N5T7Y2_9CRUS|nr:Pre-mRNA-splicing factor 38A [Armadillidium nasatum]
MANRTVKDATSVHGTNPQYLVEKIIRTRIYDSKYWKEQCFALTAELLVDKAMELRYVGGVYGGNIKPSPFLCLTLKMLQIQPEKDIIIEFIKQDDFKYVRALGAFYLRLVHSSLDCHKYLEPLLNDYRKLRIMNRNGQYELSHMDEFIDGLMREERVNDIMMPRILKRDERSRHSPTRNGIRSSRHGDKRHRSRSRDRRDDGERKRRRSRSRERRHKSPGHRHHHHHKTKDRDRERGRDREHKRRERGDKDYESSRDHHKEKRRTKDRERGERRRHRRERETSLEMEIAEANMIRAKLGMAPLRR